LKGQVQTLTTDLEEVLQGRLRPSQKPPVQDGNEYMGVDYEKLEEREDLTERPSSRDRQPVQRAGREIVASEQQAFDEDDEFWY